MLYSLTAEIEQNLRLTYSVFAANLLSDYVGSFCR